MEILSTPTQLPRTTQRVSLDGTKYRLRLTWFERLSAWYLDLATLDGTSIASGRRVSPGGNPIPGGVVGAPPGLFWVTGSKDPYDKEDLGRSVKLVYFPEEEQAALAAFLKDQVDSQYSVEVL